MPDGQILRIQLLNPIGAKSRVDLLIPGLFGPIPVPGGDLPDLPVLERLLGKADRLRTTGSDSTELLFDRFGVDPVPDRDPPSAPFSRLSESPDADVSGYWLHADPVHLRPDRDRLLLFDARHLALDRAEADSLVEVFNQHFDGDGLRLEAPSIERWYLHAEQPPRICARPLADVVGRGIERSYLSGDDAADWMRWLNEAQMLFHHADVNRHREFAGRPTVSGIWPWGGGSLADSVPQSRYDCVLAHHPLALGLASAAGVATHSIPEDSAEMPALDRGERMLLYWDAFWPAVLDGDGAAWVRELSRLESWLRIPLERLRTGDLGELVLFPCDGTRLGVTRGSLRFFWRRPGRIAAHLQGMAHG